MSNSMQLDFVLYRFVCDISTFTSLFVEDAEGRYIPDTSAFRCSWVNIPRGKSTAPPPSSSPKAGSTDSIYFKSLGDDMALTFSTGQSSFSIDSDHDVLTFFIQPSLYEGGATPVIARGTLDPLPYFNKPRKNYAIKLRDGLGQVMGKLLFSLAVQQAEAEDPSKSQRSSLARERSSLLRSSGDRHLAILANSPNADAVGRALPLVKTASPPHESTALEGRSSSPSSKKPDLTQRGVKLAVKHLDLKLEQVVVTADSIQLERPAPFLLGGEYYLKVRYGSYSFYSSCVMCRNPKVISFSLQQAGLTLPASATDEKIRFSLWEDNKQVAGFSLDPAKFHDRTPGVWREYAVPFRYHPTGQRASLDIAVRSLEISMAQSTTIATTLQTSPPPRPIVTDQTHQHQRLSSRSRDREDDNRYGRSGAAAVAERPKQRQSLLDTSSRRLTYASDSDRRSAVQTSPLQNTATQSSSLQRRSAAAAAPAPPASSPRLDSRKAFVTGAPPPQQQQQQQQKEQSDGAAASSAPVFLTTPVVRQSRASTPHRRYDGGQEVHQGMIDPTSDKIVRHDWDRTPPRERPPPLTTNEAEPKASERPPNEHERYIAEVMKRLERQQQASRQRASIMEEWMEWRDHRQNSRSSSVVNGRDASPSVASNCSYTDSIASARSRHASVPRPTKSIAENSFLNPFTPEMQLPQQRSRNSSRARPPLI